ncbi:AAA domain-containing protein 2 [Elsinoe australis]|uniref:Adenylate kinase isoenzyme 6 homolog n=1 Tax=Elsinoe australis TaxID=40998 RepID=A0A2P8A845_9PEZI|nr:Adenylate kinase isoenzyme 6 [Elsinoe australis]TKX25964.1 AAA domain-containing protein 2 [Elsinoe australis]
MPRLLPNLVITGTPGVGKTTHCSAIAEATGLTHLDVNKVVKERDCSDGYDEELETTIVDEDKLLDAIDSDLRKGGQIVDWHACDLFPASLVDLVVVVRCKTENLFDRLVKRGYSDKKREENMDAEIMEVILTEARESYDEAMVVELWSDEVDAIDDNVERIEQWIEQWKKDHPNGADQEDDE